MRIRIQLFTLMRIRVMPPKISASMVDPDTQPYFRHKVLEDDFKVRPGHIRHYAARDDLKFKV
jgi:hypothetical protein